MYRTDRRVNRYKEILNNNSIVSRPPILGLRVKEGPQAYPRGRPRGCLGGDRPRDRIIGGSISGYIISSSLLLLSSSILS